MKYIRIFIAALTMLVAASAVADDYYGRLTPPQPTHSGRKIEVLEFFFYGCIHCFHLHPELAKWVRTMPRDVSIDYVPVAFRNSWAPMAYTYYALKEMGKSGQLDDQLYDALNLKDLPLNDADSIGDFVSHNGVNRKQFIDYYNSFSVRADVDRAHQMMVDYQIQGTPTLIVEGKYVVFNNKDPKVTIENLNKVIDMVREDRHK